MVTMYDANATELNSKAAEALKKSEHVKMPEWALFVKTGTSKQRNPAKEDWWFNRTAAVLRAIYMKGPIGVGKLRVQFGGRKRRGYKPAEFRKDSGKIIRVILQQLEKEGFVKYAEKGVHKGRIITPKGKSFMDKAVKKK